MSQTLHPISAKALKNFTASAQQKAIRALEKEKILFFRDLSVDTECLNQHHLWSDELLDGSHKNISYDAKNQRLGSLKQSVAPQYKKILTHFMHDYLRFAKHLICTVLPSYQDALIIGRTSYRPAQIDTKVRSKRKDDTRLHVDSFSASPVYGRRILRVFTNINPHQEPRVWLVGEPFEAVLKRYAEKIPAYNPFIAWCLKQVRTTKTLRSAYDHYQLHLHDRMKRDEVYQQTVPHEQIDFPSASTWIVFTDQVSHAALSGQFLLEQTFYLPVDAMNQPELSPLKRWEHVKKFSAS